MQLRSVHLCIGAFRAAPYSTTAVVIAVFSGAESSFPEPRRRSSRFSQDIGFWIHFDAYVFFTTDGLDAAHVLTSMLVGCFAAFTAKRKEMIATITLVLLLWDDVRCLVGVGGQRKRLMLLSIAVDLS
jgi:hypothetical protein